jgi:hypothetical protein
MKPTCNDVTNVTGGLRGEVARRGPATGTAEHAVVPSPVSDRAQAHGPGVGLPFNPPAADDEPLRAGDFMLGAARLAAQVAANPGDSLSGSDLQHAGWWQDRASEPLVGVQARAGVGGELSPLDSYLGGPVPLTSVMLHNTLTEPTYVTADASRERLELAHKAGALETGLDAAETIQAGNSLERMLAHQLVRREVAPIRTLRWSGSSGSMLRGRPGRCAAKERAT